MNSEFLEGKNANPFFVLIYGSKNEFIHNQELNIKRNQLQRNNEVYMTFNRLTPNIKARNIITCTVKNQKYCAKYVQPVFRLGPVLAEEMSNIYNKDNAIINSDLIGNDRKIS